MKTNVIELRYYRIETFQILFVDLRELAALWLIFSCHKNTKCSVKTLII